MLSTIMHAPTHIHKLADKKYDALFLHCVLDASLELFGHIVIVLYVVPWRISVSGFSQLEAELNIYASVN